MCQFFQGILEDLLTSADDNSGLKPLPEQVLAERKATIKVVDTTKRC